MLYLVLLLGALAWPLLMELYIIPSLRPSSLQQGSEYSINYWQLGCVEKKDNLPNDFPVWDG